MQQRVLPDVPDVVPLETCTYSCLGPAGTLAVEEVAGEAAARAGELRQLTDKGARLRKKKALNDLLKALAGFGFTRRRSAVPAHNRTVQQWFSQVSGLCLHHHVFIKKTSEEMAITDMSVLSSVAWRFFVPTSSSRS